MVSGEVAFVIFAIANSEALNNSLFIGDMLQSLSLPYLRAIISSHVGLAGKMMDGSVGFIFLWMIGSYIQLQDYVNKQSLLRHNDLLFDRLPAIISNDAVDTIRQVADLALVIVRGIDGKRFHYLS